MSRDVKKKTIRKSSANYLTPSSFDSRFKTLFEQSPISMQIFSLNGNTLLVNQAWEKLWGASSETAKKYNILQDKQLEERGIMPLIQRGFKGETISIPPIKYIPTETMPGVEAVEYRWTKGILYPLHSSSGEMECIVLMHEDITEQKEWEERLKYSAGLISSITDSVITTDMDFRITGWNKAAEEMYGWKEKEVIGKSAPDILPTMIHGMEASMFRDVLFKKGAWKGEAVQKRKDGSDIYVLASTSLIRDEKGNAVGAMAVNRDITERKQYQQELQASEARYRTLVELAPDVIYTLDLKGTLTSLSPSFEMLTGWKIKDWIGKSFSELVHPEDLPVAVEKFKEGLQKTLATPYRLRILTKDGTYRVGEFRSRPYEEHGRVTGKVGVARDVTDREKSEAAIRSSENRLRKVVDSNMVGIHFWKPDGTITQANDAFLQMVGYTRRDVEKGKLNWKKITPDYETANYQADEELLNKGYMEPFEKEYIRKDGTTISVLVGGAYLDETQTEGVSFVLDITERKKLERQKDEFIGIASHELKTPVTSIKAYAQVLTRRFAKEGDEQAAMMLKKMDGQIDKLTLLIGDLLDVTKIETGKLQFHEGYFDLNELIDEAIEEMQRTTEGHTLVKKLEKSKTIYGDRDRIGQVLNNLYTNAIKYSPHGTKIITRTKVLLDEVLVSVQDFGKGIPKNKKDQVFERFFRVDGKNTESYPGLGLGLYISYEIVKRHGGRMWVESEVGKGSTFFFSLPLKRKRRSK